MGAKINGFTLFATGVYTLGNFSGRARFFGLNARERHQQKKKNESDQENLCLC
jgi:hypothetical protein